jgi:alkylation response protein AidB-like acyl-CoA dehydrogenase
MESVSELASLLADRKDADIRLEAAIAKLWNTEMADRIVDDCLQIRGGRGYETADSLRKRGERADPVERMYRDNRINRIFEGSSEIMRLFIAREAVDTHLGVAGDLVDPKSSTGTKAAALLRSALFYARWYPPLWWPFGAFGFGRHGRNARHMRFVERRSRKLARAMFHAMVRLGPRLEKRQSVLFRLVDIGAELFAMSAAVSRATAMARAGTTNAPELADVFCRHARRRVDDRFAGVFGPDDLVTYQTARRVLDGEFAWLEEGMT